MTRYDKINAVTGKGRGHYWGERIASELRYCAAMSAANENRYDAVLDQAVDFVFKAMCEADALTREIACRAEEMLSELAEAAKKYRVYCISHAHIDMNWQWGTNETAAITVNTFRTVLNLMKEYPGLTFAQSQAATYQFIEEYAPSMLEEIRQRIHEGRWELSASTWVENDKNMPNGESLARHILYTRNYLADLFDIDPDTLNLDFEPDTFGHNWNTPEILNRGGVKYYYHCRANSRDKTHDAYVWKSRSGASLITWREPKWYLGDITYDTFSDIPTLCHDNGIDFMLKVYGVGDHGGGPTRRDIERILDMMNWPLHPTITFGTYRQFFEELEAHQDILPVVNDELNYIFTGCYTSQSRLKMANRFSEDRLNESEALSAAAAFFGGEDRTKSFEQAWRRTLYNQFHDILPGSGVPETREFSMGEFQRVLAAADINAAMAMNALGRAIDTSAFETDDNNLTISEGGGAAFGSGFDSHNAAGAIFSHVERGRGKKRMFHIFNTTQYDRSEVAEIILWDWDYALSRAVFTDAEGRRTAYEVKESHVRYSGHVYSRIALSVHVPAFGYATYFLDEDPAPDLGETFRWPDRTDEIRDDDLILENELVRARFDPASMKLIEFTDKATGRCLIDQPSCGFRLITESPVYGMTSWRVGPYKKICDINEESGAKVLKKVLGGIDKRIEYELKVQRSVLHVIVALKENARMLEFDVHCDWCEIGNAQDGVPQLNFYIPFSFRADKYRYDIPFGIIDRAALHQDVPANSFAAALPNEGGSSVMAVTDTKYGFRSAEDSIAVDLIRSSYDPDPYPEIGLHKIRIGVGLVESADAGVLYREAAKFVHPLPYVSGTRHKGTLPVDLTLMKVEGVQAAAVKKPEKDGADKLIVRCFNSEAQDADARLTFAFPVKAARCVMTGEQAADRIPVTVSGSSVTFRLEKYSSASIELTF